MRNTADNHYQQYMFSLLTVYYVGSRKVARNSDAKVFVALEIVRVDVDSVGDAETGFDKKIE